MGNLCAGEKEAKKDELDVKRRKKSSKSKKKDSKSKKSKFKKTKKSKKSKKGAEVPVDPVPTAVTETWDDNDISTLLPSEPTLKDAFNSEENLEILLQAREEVESILSQADQQDWDVIKEKDGITVSRPEYKNDEIYLKKEMVVENPIEDVVNALYDLDLRKKTDGNLVELKEVESIGENSSLEYRKTTGSIIFKARDFSYAKCLIDLKNDSKVIVEFSVEHEEIPETKAVRGEIHTLYWLKKISDEETEVYSIFHILLKGGLPGFAKGIIAKKHWEDFQKLRKNI